MGTLVSEFVDKRKNLKFKATGNSMFPFIKDGDGIKISPYIENKPEIGDIVAYLDSNTRNLIVHRIIKLSANQFIAKGDSCLHSDGTQSKDDILGYVAEINQRLGLPNRLLVPRFKKIVTLLSLIRFTVILSILLKPLIRQNRSFM
ncbi:MAG: S26 family signal peptidase [Desulfobacterium sp.]|nr:S26 family signal peptidase [Desulfobacterium sp.]